jgi:hypothetical protein
MRRVAKRKQQAHGNRLGITDVGEARQIERNELTIGTESAPNAVAALERDERRRMLVAEAIQMRARLPP